MLLKVLLTFVYVTAAAFANPVSQSCEPEGLIDLGYARHIPTSTNKTASGHKVAIYKNIRFANAPTGDLRFRKPDTNLAVVEEIQDGNVPPRSLDCISSAPPYVPFPDINGTTWGQEDCLFLDVYVPEGVRKGDDVPVLHFYVGSGYAFGSKDHWFSPMGLFEHMFEAYGGRFILVANNYRCVTRFRGPSSMLHA
jgi:carboxylesterase type B